ncbi:MAG: ATP-binding protein [Clostridia bacterium]|nr:ATP-binding protein [Clostridia bacterium]
MVSREYTYKKAFERQKEAVKSRNMKREMLLSALYLSEPELGKIENELKSLGARLAIVTLAGDKEQLKVIKEKSKLLSKQKKEILKKAKIPALKYDCDLCHDTGYISGKICDCIKKEASRIMAEELSKEMPLKDCRFDNFDLKFYFDKTDSDGTNPRKRMTSILKLCREYVINFGLTSENLLFMGGVGLGKTHLTMAIVGGVIEKGFMPIYGSAENLFAIVESEKFSGEGRGNYDAMLKCDLLVIDDLGAEMTTSFTKSVLYNLINTRMLSGKPTIINTNLSMKQIEEKYSARISSRLMSNYNVNKFLGTDIRQQKLLSK